MPSDKQPQRRQMLTDTVELIRSDPWRMECLRVVESVGLPDWYIAAGFLRNAIWDLLHAKPSRTTLDDVDVVYFDAIHLGTAAEAEIEATLRRRRPEVNWDVKNQARIHLRHGHAPYRDTPCHEGPASLSNSPARCLRNEGSPNRANREICSAKKGWTAGSASSRRTR